MGTKLVRRDLFAVNALQGLISAGVDTNPWSIKETTELAYRFADAMIKASESRNGHDMDDNTDKTDKSDDIKPADDDDIEHFKMRRRGRHF